MDATTSVKEAEFRLVMNAYAKWKPSSCSDKESEPVGSSKVDRFMPWSPGRELNPKLRETLPANLCFSIPRSGTTTAD